MRPRVVPPLHDAYLTPDGRFLLVAVQGATAETADQYPYVWAEAAFGDLHDEIYVIDVRSPEIVETLRPVPGESSWHPEFTYDGSAVYVVSQTGSAVVVYDAESFEEIARIEAKTPSAVFNMGIRRHEAGL